MHSPHYHQLLFQPASNPPIHPPNFVFCEFERHNIPFAIKTSGENTDLFQGRTCQYTAHGSHVISSHSRLVQCYPVRWLMYGSSHVPLASWNSRMCPNDDKVLWLKAEDGSLLVSFVQKEKLTCWTSLSIRDRMYVGRYPVTSSFVLIDDAAKEHSHVFRTKTKGSSLKISWQFWALKKHPTILQCLHDWSQIVSNRQSLQRKERQESK